MTPRSKLLVDLRRSLKEGATPSKLIRPIQSESSHSLSYQDLCTIFEEVIHLSAVRLSPTSANARSDHRGVVFD